MTETNQKKILVLGCTGSIGTSTLDIIRNQKDRFKVCALTANTNKTKLSLLGSEFACPVSLTSEEGTEGIKSLIEKTKPDIVVNGIAGSAGLIPSMITVEHGINLALANKETIVMAGSLVLDSAKKNNCLVLPVDSEHSAIFTLLNQCKKENAESLILTASGGPFRTWPAEKIKSASLNDALCHPTWSMGAKITIDSATMANKGLEVIEAKRLFGFDTDKIKVTVHPQSIVHSLVRTKDGIVYAQMSKPDMKHPIICALDFPFVKENYMKPFDLSENFEDGKLTLTFEKPRFDDFPLLPLAFDAAKKDNAYPVAFNAANEVAVHSFINQKISFPKIAEIVANVLSRNEFASKITSISDVFEADKKARNTARDLLNC